MHVVTGNEQ